MDLKLYVVDDFPPVVSNPALILPTQPLVRYPCAYGSMPSADKS